MTDLPRREVISNLDFVESNLSNQFALLIGEADRFGARGFVFVARDLYRQASALQDVLTELRLTRQRMTEQVPGYVVKFTLDSDRPYLPGVNQCPNCNVGGCQGCDGSGNNQRE